jgi:OOP family OmpA-OmpF porin
MKKLTCLIAAASLCLMICVPLAIVMAAEIITAEDFKQNIVTTKQIVKTADNFILLIDSSMSMGTPFRDSGITKYQAFKAELKNRMGYLPDLGYNAGIFLYTPWKTVLPMQPFDRGQFMAAVDRLPEKLGGSTDLQKGLESIEPVLDGLSGRTVVFLLSDGSYSKWLGKQAPALIQKEISEKHNVCFYIISLADTEEEKAFLEELADVNECSRVIPFDLYIDRPEFNAGALFVEKSTEKIETLAGRKVVGLNTDAILFDYNKADIKPEFLNELKAIGLFMTKHPNAYAVVDGYTDSVGSLEYNLGLSRRRAEAVKALLTNNYGIAPDRLLTMWYGPTNPVASNATADGQRQNRRVEIAIGGLK